MTPSKVDISNIIQHASHSSTIGSKHTTQSLARNQWQWHLIRIHDMLYEILWHDRNSVECKIGIVVVALSHRLNISKYQHD